MANAWATRAKDTREDADAERARLKAIAFYGSNGSRDERDLIWWFTEAHGTIGAYVSIDFVPLEQRAGRDDCGTRIMVSVTSDDAFGLRDHPKYIACKRARPIAGALAKLDSGTRGVLARAFTRSKAHAWGGTFGHDLAPLMGTAEAIGAMSEETRAGVRDAVAEMLSEALHAYRVARGR